MQRTNDDHGSQPDALCDGGSGSKHRHGLIAIIDKSINYAQARKRTFIG
jgi:hypothetical protein